MRRLGLLQHGMRRRGRRQAHHRCVIDLDRVTLDPDPLGLSIRLENQFDPDLAQPLGERSDSGVLSEYRRLGHEGRGSDFQSFLLSDHRR